ncbi:BTB domain-containingand ankyrin repeat protein [Ceratocystis lukuohia]|uniref:BTB domain-containingand ankyrin repeat protein n=1 Tax=Ceratocystis lukuohia TaxID=2019550 RepID=A0ABR4MIB6_9PEZI
MNVQLWKLFWDSDVEGFCRLLNLSAACASGPSGVFAAGKDLHPSSATSPKSGKSRKGLGKSAALLLGKAELNIRDHAGLTLLLRAASSAEPRAIHFVQALLDHPAIDIYVQDPESGWNALHRALYAGNISIARLLLEKEQHNLRNSLLGTGGRVSRLIKTKDHEGNSPFDLYNSTIFKLDLPMFSSQRALHPSYVFQCAKPYFDPNFDDPGTENFVSSGNLNGNEIYMFGSNKNHSLGVGDGDDRQYPERIQLTRPENLVEYFYTKFTSSRDVVTSGIEPPKQGVPQLILSRPIVIRNVALSKLHSAIITDDPFSNLYLSGVGRGGRLGLGDEHTQFRFVPVLGGLATRKVIHVALGQNHTIAITDKGEIWTWGSNTCGQLGYTLPASPKADEDPMGLIPRQIFGTLKKETIIGAAASAIHSVAFTSTSLYCWGRNDGQIGLMDADSRSLAIQTVPRKVAASLFSSSIKMVTATEKATTCLLENHIVIVFTNYGYNIVRFPALDLLPNLDGPNLRALRASRSRARTTKLDYVASGGDTISALTLSGEVYVMSLNVNSLDNTQTVSSTTNPSKIKFSVTSPQCIWHARKDAATSIAVGENGSVMLSTRSGAVWRRVRRDKTKLKKSDEKRDAFKFERVPTITSAIAVRGSTYGALAVVISDTKATRSLVLVKPRALCDDIGDLFPLKDFKAINIPVDFDLAGLRGYEVFKNGLKPFASEVLKSMRIEEDLSRFLAATSFSSIAYDVVLSTASAPDIEIPAHSWLLAGRSSVFRELFTASHEADSSEFHDTFIFTRTSSGFKVCFRSLDIVSLLNVISMAYTDSTVPLWNYTYFAPHHTTRSRQVRAEMKKLASSLNMPALETAAQTKYGREASMHTDFRKAISHRNFFRLGDVALQINGQEILAHRELLCRRCPFFRGLFQGYFKGGWLSERYSRMDSRSPIRIDLSHFEPKAFAYVLEHLYSDVGVEIFDNLVTQDLDTFGDIVLAVMDIANELMIDRLIEICQSILGRFVNMRNVANILNGVSISYISTLKDASLEYISLQLEGFLENHLLDDMNDMLLSNLDHVVRYNQSLKQPFSRRLKPEYFFALYPLLSHDVAEERRARVQDMGRKLSGFQDDRPGVAGKGRRVSTDVTSGTPSSSKSIHGKWRDESRRQAGPHVAPPPEPRSDDDNNLIFEMDIDTATIPPPQAYDKLIDVPLVNGSSSKKKTKRLISKHESLAFHESTESRSKTPPVAPWAQVQESQPVSLITENMADAALESSSEWQSVTPSKARKVSALSVSPSPILSSAPPSRDQLQRPSPSMVGHSATLKRPASSTTIGLPKKTTSTPSVTPAQSLPSRPLNLGDFLPDASAPKAERKISMTIPPPPTQPAQPLTEIFDEQIEQRARDQEKVRIRPLQEIIQEEQFLQWWEDEQKRIEQQEEDERKSMRLVHQLIAQESLGQPASSSGTKSKAKGKNKGKEKEKESWDEVATGSSVGNLRHASFTARPSTSAPSSSGCRTSPNPKTSLSSQQPRNNEATNMKQGSKSKGRSRRDVERGVEGSSRADGGSGGNNDGRKDGKAVPSGSGMQRRGNKGKRELGKEDGGEGGAREEAKAQGSSKQTAKREDGKSKQVPRQQQ